MKRTGFSRFLNLAHSICVLFGVYRPKIIAAINANTNATTEQKAQLIALADTVSAACAAIDATRVVWES